MRTTLIFLFVLFLGILIGFLGTIAIAYQQENLDLMARFTDWLWSILLILVLITIGMYFSGKSKSSELQ